MNDSGATAVDASMQLGILEWVQSACKIPKSSYVESAVNLAWVLTKHVCRTITASPELKLQDHISVENIILFVERPELPLGGHAVYYAPLVTDVRFQFEMDAISLASL
eukprot:CAMPEP_0183780374 /NCGR_PEP_ID=MMETSP0739-20130205/56127_1 /TAXON_ID=385413 /ORGANISM="Thalassiosira miniscula, Strain CCMP1093" /LENGTH=107 /DNA_ID=CAMNT_0026023301 /DNA_START=24 /DNA_END=344 /DNA_ORIENTATION=-